MELRLWPIFRPAGRLIREHERIAPSMFHRQEVRAADRQHSGLLAQPIEDVRMLVADGLPRRETPIASRKLHGRERDVLAFDAERHARHLPDAANEERRADEQSAGERDLGHDESLIERARVPRELPRSPAFRSRLTCRRTRTSDGTRPNISVMPARSISARPSTRPFTAGLREAWHSHRRHGNDQRERDERNQHPALARRPGTASGSRRAVA